MNYKRVIVSGELPNDCRSCFHFLLGYHGAQCDFVGDIVPFIDGRPSNCPLELETDVQTVQMGEQEYTQKPSAEIWQDMIELLEKLNRKIASLPKPPESHGT
jgi:hypothetical protein